MAKKRILFMDDDKSMCGFMVLALEHEYEVKTAHTPMEALSLAQAEKFDIAIFDYHLSGSNLTGISTAAILEDIGINIPIGLLTVYSREELNSNDSKELKQLRNLAFFEIKPVTAKGLQKLISGALRQP